MRHGPALLLSVLLGACGPQWVAPEEPEAQASRAITQQVVVDFEHGEALFTVTRLEPFAPDDDTAALLEPLEVPPEAVASDLEVLAGGSWQRADFLDAAVAGDSWDELTTLGEAPAQLVAMLDEDLFGQLSLHAFGLTPGATLGVRYRLRAPAVWSAGSWSVVYPEAAGQQVSFELPPGVNAEPVVDGESGVRTGTRLVMAAAPVADADARWAVAALGQDRALWRLELDVAKALGRVPVRPTVVFAVDASHTEGPAGIAAQLELLPGYLAHVPDARVEVVLYRRRAERLFGTFVNATELPALLQAVPAERLLPGNGSNLDEACVLAADLLAEQPGPGRLVLMTDEELKTSLTAQTALQSLRRLSPDAVVHLVHRESGEGVELSEWYAPDEALAEVARAHGGTSVQVAGHSSDPSVLALTLLGLVRPVRIDALEIDAQGLSLEVPDFLGEGQALRQTAFAPSPPATVTVRGKIWGRDFERTLTNDQHLVSRLPAIALGTAEVRAELTEQEERQAAMAIGAVSRQTSYLWAPADAAASVAGHLSAFGWGGCLGGGSFSSVSRCGLGWREARVQPDRLALLRGLLAPGAAACASLAPGAPAHLTVEATRDEVVEVEASAGSAELASCLTEAAWQIRLGPEFTGHERFELGL